MNDKDPRRAVQDAAIDAVWRAEKAKVLASVSQSETSVNVPEPDEAGDPTSVSEELDADLEPEIDLQFDDAQYLAMMEAELRRLDSHGLLDGLTLITDVPTRFEHDLKDKASGLYNTQTGELYVAPEEVIGEEPRERQAQEGYFSTEKNFGSVWHELGHHWVRRTDKGPDMTVDDEEYWGQHIVVEFAEEKFGDMETFHMETVGTVSAYATEGGMEFVAEAFAGMIAGNGFPEWVMDLYDRLGGHVPPQGARDPSTAYTPMVAPSAASPTAQVAAAATEGAAEAAIAGAVGASVVSQRGEITSAQGLVDSLDPHVEEIRHTKHVNEVSLDFKLPMAMDAPFASSATYDPEDNEITGAALRFSAELLEKRPEHQIKQWLDGVLDRTDPPGGTLWTTYIRGDAQVTGPHIMAPGGFSAIDPDEFAAWVPRVIEAYEQRWGDGPLAQVVAKDVDPIPDKLRATLADWEPDFEINGTGSQRTPWHSQWDRSYEAEAGVSGLYFPDEGLMLLDNRGGAHHNTQWHAALNRDYLLDGHVPDRVMPFTMDKAHDGDWYVEMARSHGGLHQALAKQGLLDDVVKLESGHMIEPGWVWDVVYAARKAGVPAEGLIDYSFEQPDASVEETFAPDYLTPLDTMYGAMHAEGKLPEQAIDREALANEQPMAQPLAVDARDVHRVANRLVRGTPASVRSADYNGYFSDPTITIDFKIPSRSPRTADRNAAGNSSINAQADGGRITEASIRFPGVSPDRVDREALKAFVEKIAPDGWRVRVERHEPWGGDGEVMLHPHIHWSNTRRGELGPDVADAAGNINQMIKAWYDGIGGVLDGEQAMVAASLEIPRSVQRFARYAQKVDPEYTFTDKKLAGDYFSYVFDIDTSRGGAFSSTVTMFEDEGVASALLRLPPVARDWWQGGRLETTGEHPDEIEQMKERFREYFLDQDPPGDLDAWEVTPRGHSEAGPIPHFKYAPDVRRRIDAGEFIAFMRRLLNNYDDAFPDATTAKDSRIQFREYPDDTITVIKREDEEIAESLREAAVDGVFDGGNVTVDTAPVGDLGNWGAPGTPNHENPLALGQGATVRMPLEDFRELQTYIGVKAQRERRGEQLSPDSAAGFWAAAEGPDSRKKIEKYKEILRGEREPGEYFDGLSMPYVEIGKDGSLRGVQEGRHRLIAAEEAGLDTIPVRIVYNESRDGEGLGMIAAKMTDLEVEIQNLSVGRGHSYRNFDPEEFHTILDKVDALDDQAAQIDRLREIRDAFDFIEGGRFTPFLDSLSEFFYKLDSDEMALFTKRNPEMVAWMSAYNRANEHNAYQQYLDLARETSDGDWNPTDPPAFEHGDGDLGSRRRSYRNWAPSEFVEAYDALGVTRTVRSYFERIEAGRFAEMVDLAYKFFIPLDMDERVMFGNRNPGLTEWISISAWTLGKRHGDALFHTADGGYPFLGVGGPRPDDVEAAKLPDGGKMMVPDQQGRDMQPRKAVNEAVHEAVQPVARPDFTQPPEAVRHHINEWFEEHEEQYRKVWDQLDQLRSLWESSLSRREKIAYLKGSYLFAVFSIQTDLALGEVAFERVVEGWDVYEALQTEIDKFDDTPGLGPQKTGWVKRAFNEQGVWGELVDLLDSGRVDAAHKLMIDDVTGLGAVKGGFTLAQLGFVQKMCVDGNVARLFGGEQPTPDSVETYNEVCEDIRNMMPELSEKLASYELQWLLFDWQRQYRSQGGRVSKTQDVEDPVANHEEWFDIMLGDTRKVTNRMEELTTEITGDFGVSDPGDFGQPAPPDVPQQIDDAIQAAVGGKQINDREFGVIVPKYDNSGRRIKPEVLEGIAQNISERFGGVTVYPSVAGCWIPEEGPMAGELMCDENIYITTVRDSSDGVSFEDDANFLRNLGEDVAQDLGQFSVMVTEDRMEAELIEGDYEESLDQDKLASNVFKGLL